MAKVNRWITVRKAAIRGVQYAAVTIAALQTVPVPEGIGVERQVTVSFIIGALGAIAKGIHNYRKISRQPVRYSGYALLVVGLLTTLAGCVTTTAPDGTVTQSVDTVALSTAWDRYERLQARRDALEAERARAPVATRLEIDTELHGLDREIDALGERLGVQGRRATNAKKMPSQE